MLPPGSTIGILGGGQLGRMLTTEAHRLGFRTAVLTDRAGSSAAQVADDCVIGALDNIAAATDLAERCAVVTAETEHIHPDVLDAMDARDLMRPRGAVIKCIQDRLTQKDFLSRHGFAQTPYIAIGSAADCRDADAFPYPAVLKTRRAGYDGKGQTRVRAADDLAAAWQRLGQQPAVLEAFVDFRCEISAIVARTRDGATATFPVAENVHERHVLFTSRVPARIPPALQDEAIATALGIAEAFDYVGVLAVEYFVTADGRLLVNEIAPRLHNSGHFTLGGCQTSQFEQHVRAIAGLPLGATDLLQPVTMINLLGDPNRPAVRERVLALPGAQVHLYGKSPARPGRKTGHVLVFNGDETKADALTDTLRALYEAEGVD